MKNHLLTVTATLLLTIPNITLAQDKPAAPGGPENHGPGPGAGMRLMNPEQRLKFMTEKLGLTEDQQAKIKAIFESHAPAIKELMGKDRSTLTDEDKTKMKEMMKSEHDEIDAVLTAEQKAKAEQMRAARGHGGPGGPGGPGGKEKPADK